MAYCCLHRHPNSPGAVRCARCVSLVEGALIADYRILACVGSGAASVVYLAEQQSLNRRRVVIKVLRRAQQEQTIQHFQSEAALLASLSHPYILPIYAYGVMSEQEGTESAMLCYVPYLVLPYAEQGSLADLFVREGRQPWTLERVAALAKDAAEALDYAHQRGVLHRDVKPANLLQMGSHALLSDFSVASLIDLDMTHLEAPRVGSPGFMAPEVWNMRPGRYSDQYALAVSCFCLLTGGFPWQKDSSSGMLGWLNVHCFVPPRPIRELRPELPGSVDSVLQRALAKDPHERYPNAQAFANDLQAAAQEMLRLLHPPSPAMPVRMLVAEAASLRPAPLKVQTDGKEQRAIAAPKLVAAPDAQPGAADQDQRTELTGRPKLPESFPAREGQLAPLSLTATASPTAVASTPAPLTYTGRQAQTPEAREVHTEQFSQSLFSAQHKGAGWAWGAFLLNLLTSIVLAIAYGYTQGEMRLAANLLLALWPACLVGPLLARLFRRRFVQALAWSLCWGILFGVVDALLSAAFCYLWTALVLTIPHWGRDWLYPGDGLRIFLAQLTGLAWQGFELLLAGLAMMVLGGACLGIFIGWRAQWRYSGKTSSGISISSGVNPP